MAERQKKEIEALPWSQQLRLNEDKKHRQEFPHIIPDSVASKNQEAERLMLNLKSYIAKTLSEVVMMTWIDPCKPKMLEGKTLHLWFPSVMSAGRPATFWGDYVRQTYGVFINNFAKFHALEEVRFYPYVSAQIIHMRAA